MPHPKEPELVSILLPTYNRANLLKKCINSILEQTYSNWELIIYDDGSTDNTSIVARRFAEKEQRIRYFANPSRAGLPRTRNLAISVSCGDFTLFVEDDLVLEPNCIAVLVDSYFKLMNKGIQVGAVAPRLITTRRERANPMASVLDLAGDSRREKMTSPCEVNNPTGIIYRNFDKEINHIQEVSDVHACSLFPRYVFNQVGGYSSLYTGNYVLQESDFHFRLRKKGYKLYFQSEAVAHHKEAESGGCDNRSLSWRYHYYFARNQSIFLVRNFGVKAVYMLPCCFSYLAFVLLKFSIISTTGKARQRLRGSKGEKA